MIVPLVWQTLAVPTVCLRCGARVDEDTQFTADMAIYAMQQRRYVCAGGHSIYMHLPLVDTTKPAPSCKSHPARRIERVCVWCGDDYMAVARQKYCSDLCARAADVERSAQRTPAGRYGLTGAALKAARNIQVWRRTGPPSAYAARPAGLSKAWV